MRRIRVLRDTPTEASGGSGGDPGIEIPGEGATLTPEQQTASNIETTAKAKGWKPEGEYQGEEGTHIGAKEFLNREPLFDRIKTQSKQIKGLTKTVEAMVNQHKTQVNAEVARRLSELKVEKKEAIELGDVDKVEKIDAEIDQQKAATVQSDEPPTEVADWIDENPWFKDNTEMNEFAIAFNKTSFAKTKDVMASLKATRKAVERAFPEEFKPGKESEGKGENKQPIDPVEGGGEAKGGGEKTNYNLSRLSEEQKLVYNQHVKVHKILSHEEYFAGLEQIGELS